MLSYKCFVFVILLPFICCDGNPDEKSFSRQDQSIFEKNILKDEKVEIRVYYESLCQGCRDFSGDLRVVKNQLNPYLNIQTYPFGNAEMHEENNTITFKCQHGPEECYGNMLHACALDILPNKTIGIDYNICLMEFFHQNSGSDDVAADRCGYIMSINSEPIKKCAKGQKGIQLLKYYAEESAKVNYRYVPYVLINGKVFGFINDVCEAFTVPPEPCKNLK